MTTKQDESDTLNPFSEKDQRFIKENKLVLIIQTDLPKNNFSFTSRHPVNQAAMNEPESRSVIVFNGELSV